jgi:hypothetical protein
VSDMDLEMPLEGTPDETDISLRAYFTQFSDERLRAYDPHWSDDEIIAWDGNFRSDGTLMLVCCERDVEVDEYRQVIAEHIRHRGLV